MPLDGGTIRGARGLVKHAYLTAAEVTGFVLTFDRATRRSTLGGMVKESNPYLLALRPLLFVMPIKAGAARWPIETIALDGAHPTARLGPMLERE